MPTTFPDNIYYADTSTPSNDVAVSAAQATSVQLAFSKRVFDSYRWANAAERLAQTGSSGDTGHQADSNTLYTWSGAAGWIPSRTIVDVGLVTPYANASAIATGTTLATITLGAIPVSSTILFNMAAGAGNTSGADQTATLQFFSTAGTPNAQSTPSIDVRNLKWSSISSAPHLFLPANTAATVTFKTASAVNLLWQLNGNFTRVV